MVIQGVTGRGKSVIVRALKALLYNEWSSDYIRDGEKECYISLEVDPSYQCSFRKISLLKSKTKNEYTITLPNGEERLFPKVGKEVPVEIMSEGLEVFRTEQGSNVNLNFQHQFDPLFLTTSSEVELTSFFSKVFNVDKYEKACRNILADLGKLKQELKEVEDSIIQEEDDLRRVEEELNSSEDLEIRMRTLMTQYQDTQNTIDKLRKALTDRDYIETLRDSIRVKKEVLEGTQGLKQYIDSMLTLVSEYKDIKVASNKNKKLSSNIAIHTDLINTLKVVVEIGRERVTLLQSYIGIVRSQNKVYRVKGTLERVQAMDFLDKMKKAIEKVESFWLEISSMQRNLSKGKDLQNKIRVENENREKLDNYSQDVRQYGEVILKDYGMCPVCKQGTK